MADPIQRWFRNSSCSMPTFHEFRRTETGQFRCTRCRLLTTGVPVLTYALGAKAAGADERRIAPDILWPRGDRS